MKNSNIEWTDHTFNPWIGCTKVSPGCVNCYAEADQDLRRHRVKWGKGQPRSRTSADYWKEPLKWNREGNGGGMRCTSCGKGGYWSRVPGQRPICGWCKGIVVENRPRVFCASLADWLDDEVCCHWLVDLLKLIHDTPNLDWLLLTKRPKNFLPRIAMAMNIAWGIPQVESPFAVWVEKWLCGEPPANVWIGTSVEDQQRADERIPALLKIPARVRFLSCEPLLGHLNVVSNVEQRGAHYKTITSKDWLEKIHWVICGGESGPNARPMHPDWARSLRDQCAAAGVPFLFKQWGEWAPAPDFAAKMSDRFCWVTDQGKIYQEFRTSFGITASMIHVGKRAAGRLLNGVDHNEFPKVEVAA